MAHGASLAGGRSVACMKHVGLNVASELAGTPDEVYWTALPRMENVV